MSDETMSTRSVLTPRRSYIVVIVAALVIGALIGPPVFGAAVEHSESTDEIAVIPVGTTIAPQTAEPVAEALQEARKDDNIKAVVLEVDTPGGSLAATEALALEVERTAAEMPVIVSVTSMAASGGYYISAPADAIVANPSALVGSIGINFAYLDAPASSTTIQSGPDKSGGFTESEAIEMAEVMVNGFYGIVLEHRGDELTLTKEELAYAKVYPSQYALHNGLIDEIGTKETAIQRAAEMAGLESYTVTEFDTTIDLPGLIMLGGTDDEVDDVTGEHVQALLDPAPGVETPVPLALYGSLPDQQTIVTTAGSEPATVVAPDASSNASEPEVMNE